MEEKDLKDYKKKIGKLSEEEQKQRNLHLKGLADGTIQGPETGYPSIDKNHLKYFKEEDILSIIENKSAYQELYDSAKENLDYIAIDYFGFKIKYRELLKRIDTIASYLVEIGVKKGENVSVALPNTPEAVYLFYAINKIGATANMIDVRFKADRLKECLNSVESKKLFIFNDMVQEMDKIIDETKIDNIVSINAIESLPKPIQLMQKNKAKKEGKVFYQSPNADRITKYSEMLKIGKKANHKVEVVYDESIPAALEHTSGTTGTSKVVSLPNKTFLAMVNGYNNCPIELNEQDVFLNLIPPFLAYGLVASIHFPLVTKMELALIPKFEEEKFYDQLVHFKPAVTNATKVHWNAVKNNVESLEKRVEHLKKEIAKTEDIIDGKVTGLKDLKITKKELAKMKKALVKAEEKVKEANFDFLVVGGIGGDAVGAETMQQLNDFLKQHNCKYNLSPGYGMTELGSTAIAWPGGIEYDPSTTGIPFVKNETMVLDTDTGEELSYDQVGELYISGPSMMKEYLNNEEGTKSTVVEMDGKKWIKTGDLAHITEDGAVTIDGRIKRLIITDGGNKIFPIVIENVILQHLAVKDACVVGVPDDTRGMIAKAHIVLKEEYLEFENMILSQIEELCKEKIIDQSLPSEYQIDSELPKTPANKVDVKELERRDSEMKKARVR